VFLALVFFCGLDLVEVEGVFDEGSEVMDLSAEANEGCLTMRGMAEMGTTLVITSEGCG
jgi:hypothetical protein